MTAPAGARLSALAGGDSLSAEPYGVVRGQLVPAKDVADLIAEAILAVPGAADLHGGPFGTVATYLPGRRVAGVAVREDTARALGDPDRKLVEVSVVAAAERGLRTDLQALAARVRAAVTPLVEGPVSVTIADLAGPTA